MIPTICFTACHAGPAAHFAAFAEELKKDYIVEVWASPIAAPYFEEPQVMESLDEEMATTVARSCEGIKLVMTDLGHSFDVTLQKAFERICPKVRRFTYYDNPEAHVPGDYNKIAGEVMQHADVVLIANADIAVDERMGIGYYPIERARQLMRRRLDERERLRAEFFYDLGRKDGGETVCVYLGGNNSDFYNEAYPAFCKMVQQGPKYLFVVQPHPQSHPLELPKGALLSSRPTDEMVAAADVVLYHQTSMAPMLAFAGIPLIQVGKKIYEDLLTRSGIEFAATEDQLKGALLNARRRIFEPSLVGFRQNWPERLKHALNF